MTASVHRPEEDGDAVEVGAFAFLGDPHVVDLLAASGVDWVCLDCQHGRFDDAKVLATLDMKQESHARLVVRVRALDAGLIGRALDSGAEGIIVPMIESAADARKAVSASFYPPRGQRSFGPIRSIVGDRSDTDLANDRVMCAVMVETRAAVDAIEQIASTPGVGMLFVGPYDLALALGTTVDDLLNDDSRHSPLRRIADAAGDSALQLGAFAGTPERATRLIELGFTFIAVTGDTSALAYGTRTMVESIHQLVRL